MEINLKIEQTYTNTKKNYIKFEKKSLVNYIRFT